jgi:hypothetical protein
LTEPLPISRSLRIEQVQAPSVAPIIYPVVERAVFDARKAMK